jgi:hypothetical protein
MKTIRVMPVSLPEIEDATRREFLVGGAAALLLAGCGGEEGARRCLKGIRGPSSTRWERRTSRSNPNAPRHSASTS